MKKTTLVIMAAGSGRRFGKGTKQLEPVGKHGEIIMDYSIHDALDAGFNKVVFVIRRDLEDDFRKIIGDRIEKIAEIAYVFQELGDLPEGHTRPERRTKPWGTGQAVLSARGLLHEPFAVINADDYYGRDPFVKLHDYLSVKHTIKQGMHPVCMAGFVLGNTLSDNGGVTRGVCNADESGNLLRLHETSNIVKTKDGAAVDKDGKLFPLDANSLVSMNMWGMQPEFLGLLEQGFAEFLSELQPGDIKSEYLLPIYMNELMKTGKVQIRVLKTNATWFGVTYKEDKAAVVESFRKLIEKGVYSERLYE